MDRFELLKTIKDEYASIISLYELKNFAYGNDDNAFHNFTETARRVFNNPDLRLAFRVLLILMDKHLVALANRGLDDPEVVERLRDVAVYSLIGLAMAQEHARTPRLEELQVHHRALSDEELLYKTR